MSRLNDKIAGGRLLWIDAQEYAARLLANGQPPLLDVAEYVSWHRKSQGLLKSGVAVFDVAPVVTAWIARDASLKTAMAAKRRATAPLKALLADEALRDHLRSILQGLRACHGDLPLVLEIPSPRRWLIDSFTLAHGEAPDAGADEVDSGAVYVADFLRAFGDSGLDALLMIESTETEPATSEEVEWYQAVCNLASHYRWDVGLKLPQATSYSGGNASLQFVIAPNKIDGLPTGLILPPSFWNGGDTPSNDGGFLYAEIPADAVPEQVLARLASLR